MKKVCGLFLAILCLTVVTGCGSSKNEITCTTKQDGQKVVVTVKTDKDDKITSLKMSNSMEAPSKEELDSTYKLLNATLDEINKNEGTKVSLSKKGLTLTMTAQVDLTKISDDVRSSLGIGDEFNTTGAEFKKSATSNGATCK